MMESLHQSLEQSNAAVEEQPLPHEFVTPVTVRRAAAYIIGVPVKVRVGVQD